VVIRRTRNVGFLPIDAFVTRLVVAVMLEYDEHEQIEGRRMFSAGSMADIPPLIDRPGLDDRAVKHALSGNRATTKRVRGKDRPFHTDMTATVQAHDLISQSSGP